jgi:hypothetical protein
MVERDGTLMTRPVAKLGLRGDYFPRLRAIDCSIAQAPFCTAQQKFGHLIDHGRHALHRLDGARQNDERHNNASSLV